MKILVAITSFGATNDQYLERLIKEYRSMRYQVDIVVLSNVHKELPPGVELVVGLPTSDPWSLPFAHKSVLASRVDRYDLFIYSENDILITEKNIQAFLKATAVLADDEIAGFLRTETHAEGRKYYPDVHQSYHWDPASVVRRGAETFAYFSCEHAACYILNRLQLQRAIDSGGFSVQPHQGKYDLACSAATDPYTQCGFKKLVCISDLDGFLVPHLSNKYGGTNYATVEDDFDPQIESLREIETGAHPQTQLLAEEKPLTRCKWFKNYYEPAKAEVVAAVSPQARSVLSLGCGWGSLEAGLVQRGLRVVGVPLDSVIAACAGARGVRTISPDFAAAWRELAGQQFDCVVISNILHLVPDPAAILRECARLLSDGGQIILVVPNFNYLKVLWRRIRGLPGYRNLGNYGEGGVNLTTHRIVQKWLKSSGLIMEPVIELAAPRVAGLSRLLGVAGPYLASELIVVCHPKAAKARSIPVSVKSQYSQTQSQPEAKLSVTV
jgi:2-polyprenyl-3-methyl-5-hydroxy-6-metoxy-1,4-benzoquinol methylase